MAIERRFSPAGKALAPVARTTNNGKEVISGYAAVFYDGTPGTQYTLWDGMVERIAKGAFDNAIRTDDVRALFNHDVNQVLGRTAAGTLHLKVDYRGLIYGINAADTVVASDLAEHLRRGDVTGSSFSFEVLNQRFIEEGGVTVRLIDDLKLYDVGPVTFPAYQAASSGVA